MTTILKGLFDTKRRNNINETFTLPRQWLSRNGRLHAGRSEPIQPTPKTPVSYLILPIELWMIIANTLTRTELRNLCSISKAFRSALIGLMFSETRLTPYSDQKKYLWMQNASFIHTMVQSLSLEVGLQQEKIFPHIFWSLPLSSFIRLHSLRLVHTLIPLEQISSIQDLPLLNKLDILDCSLPYIDGRSDIKYKAIDSLRSLSVQQITSVNRTRFYNFVIQENLQRLESLEIDAGYVNVIIGQHHRSLERLRNLTIKGSSQEIDVKLPLIFTICTKLMHLSLEYPIYDAQTMEGLLPNLESLACDTRTAGILFSGRKIKRYRLILQNFGHSSSLPPRLLPTILKCPLLESLEAHITISTWEELTTSPILGKLRSLSVDFHDYTKFSAVHAESLAPAKELVDLTIVQLGAHVPELSHVIILQGECIPPTSPFIYPIVFWIVDCFRLCNSMMSIARAFWIPELHSKMTYTGTRLTKGVRIVGLYADHRSSKEWEVGTFSLDSYSIL